MPNSTTEHDSESISGDASSASNKTKQPFANYNLEPGEWDIRRKDPYYRPKPPPRSRLTSAEDFANRPSVGFDNEFSTYDDSMIALSWMDSKTSKQIYQSYVELMIRAQNDSPGRTSHEYACRVLAQRFRITPWRAAGVVQLQHNEEQMRRNNPELLCEEQAQYAEEAILQNIRDAHRSEKSEPIRGQAFVEDPVGIHGRGAPDEVSSSFVSADDVFDMEAKLHAANERDDELARILIDEHVYKEDADESSLEVKTDGAAKRLIKARELYQGDGDVNNKEGAGDIPFPETNAQGAKRPRWKYVAKVVNTRTMRKKGRRSSSYTNNNMENTLVEEDGSLRVATVEEAKQASWKPSRTKGSQYIYEGAQRAWLERTIQGKTDVWGLAPKESAVAAVLGKMGGEDKAAAKAAADRADIEASEKEENSGDNEIAAKAEESSDDKASETDMEEENVSDAEEAKEEEALSDEKVEDAEEKSSSESDESK
ncbi:MAG: hypothetical protein SGILL_006347 [Bacillariaceae sp.]